MKKIVFITNNIFTKRDVKRYGFDTLKKKFLIEVLSFGKFQKDNIKNIKYFDNYNSFHLFFLKSKPHAAIDLLFPSFNSFLVKRIIKKNGTKLIKLKLNYSPTSPKNFTTRLLNIFRKKKIRGGSILNKLKNHFFIKLNSFYNYDFLFIASRKENFEQNTGLIIKNHSFDYDIFLSNIKKIKNNKIVFIDGDIIFNKDYKIHSTKAPVSKNSYMKVMNIFLDKVEKEFKKKIIIAAAPKSEVKKISQLFNNRKVVINKTFDLIRESELVIVHKSTAVSFAVLLKKPILFLTSDELNKTWFGDDIKDQAMLLSSKVFNVNQKTKISKKDIYSINEKKYKKYINDYIKYPRSKKINNWDLFVQSI